MFLKKYDLFFVLIILGLFLLVAPISFATDINENMTVSDSYDDVISDRYGSNQLMSSSNLIINQNDDVSGVGDLDTNFDQNDDVSGVGDLDTNFDQNDDVSGVGDLDTNLDDVGNVVDNDVANYDFVSTSKDVGTFTQLNALIANASDCVVDLDQNYSYTAGDDSYKNGINITSVGEFTINGNGYTINGSNLARIFNHGAGTLNINNITLCNANSSSQGGAIYSTANLNVIGSNFTNNKGSSGGAIYSNSTVNVIDSNFINNTGDRMGGAIYSESMVDVFGSNFINNTGDRMGGAIYSESMVDVNSSNFINNTASGGGAIYSSSVNVFGSNFTNNTAHMGGAIWLDRSGVSFSNSSGGVNVSGSNFINNTATNGGGVIYGSSGSVNVNGSNFTNNNGSTGGVILCDSCSVNVSGSNFINNTADIGGVISTLHETSVNVSGSNFINNTVTDIGGAIYSNMGGVNVTDSNFINNTAINNGGAIYSNIGGVNVNGSIFINNTADVGGAIYSNSSVNVYGSNFINNSANVLGGVIVGYNCSVNVNDSNFINNTADVGGGAIIGDSCSVNVSGSNFINNTADIGGGIYTSPGSSVNVSGSNFINNNASMGLDIGYCGSFVADSCFWGSNFQDKTSFNNTGKIIKLTDESNDVPDNWVNLIIVGDDEIYGDSVYSVYAVLNSGEFVDLNLPAFDLRVNASNGVMDPENITFKGNKSVSTYKVCASGDDCINLYSGDVLLNSKDINVDLIFDTSIVEDYFVTVVNGSVTVTVISPNGTVDQGYVELICNGTSLGVENVTNGSATFNISDLGVGNYSIMAYYVGNDDFMDVNKTINLEVDPVETMFNTVFIVKNMSTSVLSGDLLNITLCDELGNFLSDKNISLTLFNSLGGNKTYYVTTDANGSAYLKINLREGNYSILAKFDGDENYNLTNATVNVVVESNALVMSADNYTNVFGQKGNFTTKLTDSKGNALAGYECILRLYNYLGEHKDYYRTTNTEGVAKLNIGLIPGNWTIECFYPGGSLGPESNHSIGNVTISSE